MVLIANDDMVVDCCRWDRIDEIVVGDNGETISSNCGLKEVRLRPDKTQTSI